MLGLCVTLGGGGHLSLWVWVGFDWGFVRDRLFCLAIGFKSIVCFMGLLCVGVWL